MRPRRISIRRKKLAADAEPLRAAPQPAAAPYFAAAKKPFNAALLKIGDYLLGEPDCPTLYGHPGIRY